MKCRAVAFSIMAILAGCAAPSGATCCQLAFSTNGYR